MSWYPYAVSAAMLVAAIALNSRSKRGNFMRARDVSGNVVVGNVSGTVSQATTPDPSSNRKPDRVAWVIGIFGVVVAALQLAHDLLTK